MLITLISVCRRLAFGAFVESSRLGVWKVKVKTGWIFAKIVWAHLVEFKVQLSHY